MAQNAELGHQPTPIFTGDVVMIIVWLGIVPCKYSLMASCNYHVFIDHYNYVTTSIDVILEVTLTCFRDDCKDASILDETGADRRNCLRRFGYSLRGFFDHGGVW